MASTCSAFCLCEKKQEKILEMRLSLAGFGDFGDFVSCFVVSSNLEPIGEWSSLKVAAGSRR